MPRKKREKRTERGPGPSAREGLPARASTGPPPPAAPPAPSAGEPGEAMTLDDDRMAVRRLWEYVRAMRARLVVSAGVPVLPELEPWENRRGDRAEP